GILVCDRADAGHSSVDHTHPSGSLLRFAFEEDFFKGNRHQLAVRRPDSVNNLRAGADGTGYPVVSQAAGLGEADVRASETNADQGIHSSLPRSALAFHPVRTAH